MEVIFSLSDDDKKILLDSIEIIKKNLDFFIIRFYEHFLKTGAGSLFQHTAMDKQYQMFATAINIIFNHINNPQQLAEFVEELSLKHISYGVLPEHTDDFINSFMIAIKEVFKGEKMEENMIELWYQVTSDVLTFFKEVLKNRNF